MDVCYYHLQCCGLMELDGVADWFRQPKPEEAISYVAQHANGCEARLKPAHIIFSDITGRDGAGGRALAAYITKHKLGALHASRPARNPNTGNYVRVWTWTPNWKKVLAHAV